MATTSPTVGAVELRVGCAMWAFRAWHGHPLPERVAKDDQLAAYAAWCNAVEGNTTFYGLPSTTTVASWADQPPDGFRFLFKLPRTITHDHPRAPAAQRRRRGARVRRPAGPTREPGRAAVDPAAGLLRPARP